MADSMDISIIHRVLWPLNRSAGEKYVYNLEEPLKVGAIQ